MNHRAWILILDLFELSVKGKIALSRNRFIKTVAKNYDVTQSISNAARSKHENELKEILATHYKKVAATFRNKVRADVKHHGLKLEKKSDFDSIIAEWITTQAMQKAQLIGKTDAQDIADAIEQGLLEGLPLPEISKNIRAKTGLTAVRASTIARTETHNAATYASLQSIREVEQETGAKFMKQWIATNDSRTRDRHAEMIGSAPIPVDEKFYVGGEYLDRPSDSSGSPENVVNCRCQIIFMEQE